MPSAPLHCPTDPGMFCAYCLPEACMFASLARGLPFAYLALGRDLLLVAVRRVPRDLAGPQCDSHYSVRIADHQQGEEVD